MNNYINILSIKILNTTMQEALNLIKINIKNKTKSLCYFVNADCLNISKRNKEYYNALVQSKYIFGDGSGVRIASNICKTPIIENVNGTDMFPLLCELSAKENFKIYLLGARPGIAKLVKENMQKKFKKINIVGYHHGYFDHQTENNKIINDINKSKADIVFVAFGAPNQEIWIKNNSEKISAPIILGVGGLFDFFSGRIPRAPFWMRKLGIEWCYRLLQEPKRMWKRYILGNPLFIYNIYRWKWFKK